MNAYDSPLRAIAFLRGNARFQFKTARTHFLGGRQSATWSLVYWLIVRWFGHYSKATLSLC